MSLATCPNCGKQSMGFRYRSKRSPLGCKLVRCGQCGYKSGDAQPTRRVQYVVSLKIHTVSKDKAQKLVKAGNAVYI
jgi:C4-type Zn-finger protein